MTCNRERGRAENIQRKEQTDLGKEEQQKEKVRKYTKNIWKDNEARNDKMKRKMDKVKKKKKKTSRLMDPSWHDIVL